jgi:hypothetical protein
VERFVSDVYACRYGARVPVWAPVLASVRRHGRIVAAAGWRGAVEPLYLERYLAEPVERRIAVRSGRPMPARAHVAEVGHLAAARCGEGLALMLRLAEHLAGQGYGWIVSTATPGVRAAFERMGIEAFELGRASADAAGPHAADWGRYYERGPTVLAGEIAANLARLRGGAGR